MKRLPMTWPAVMARWSTHGVQRIPLFESSRSFGYRLVNGFTHRYWVTYYGETCGYFSEPAQQTGRHLVDGVVKAAEETFAAFAIVAFLRNNGMRRGTAPGLQEWARLDALACSALPRTDYWHPSARQILPPIARGHLGSTETASWQEGVEGAAIYWAALASEYVLAVDDMTPRPANAWRG